MESFGDSEITENKESPESFWFNQNQKDSEGWRSDSFVLAREGGGLVMLG